jgi:drug/metabolite transporter (DMT)-like permease
LYILSALLLDEKLGVYQIIGSLFVLCAVFVVFAAEAKAK